MDTYTVDQALPGAPGDGGRRMRTVEEKLRIVQETLMPGISVAAVARRHGVNANLLFSWRRQHEQGVLAKRTRLPKATKLLSVQVSAPVALVASNSDGTIEIELPCGVRVRVMGEVATQRLMAVLSALAQR